MYKHVMCVRNTFDDEKQQGKSFKCMVYWARNNKSEGLWIITTRKEYERGMRKEQNKNHGSLKKSQEYLWDCWMSMLCVFLAKKSHKIHSLEETDNL